MLNSTDGCLDKPRRAGESVKNSLILCLLIDDKHIFGTLQGSVHTFLTLIKYLFLLTTLIDIS